MHTLNAVGSDETLGQLAAHDIRKARVFKKYGLDFCCGGTATLKDACTKKGLDPATLELELQQADKMSASRPLSYNEWPLDFLADYIVNTHHSYVKQTLPDLKAFADKVAKAHGKQHPELAQIQQLVKEVDDELTQHLFKEEKILFPYIKTLVTAAKSGQPLQQAGFGTVQNPIRMIETEHEMVGKNLARIRELSANYLLPEGACNSYKLLYSLLEEFEDDLHLHIHLENNILFPKALELEEQLKK
jgi:regulator of cell morphogenesis and NO signaling